MPDTKPTTTVLVEVRVDGVTTPEVLELDLDLSNPSLQESVIWEEELGAEAFGELMAGRMRIDTPKKLRVFLYGRLKARYPDLDIAGFDLDYDTLAKVLS